MLCGTFIVNASFCLASVVATYVCLCCLCLQEGQESSIAYSKCKSDIDTMGMDMDALLEKVNSAPNTEGLGGIPGLFGELRRAVQDARDSGS